ncbi:MAG TPA: PilT/PilU family type 4a pilus ATPase [Planctomycetota bacterium]|nr:PilT/PilU family type 4a pilus ATPase [Planctomycetota bacterium]
MEENLFGQILINFNLITKDQLEKALDLQRRTQPPKLLGEILVEQGMIDEKSLKSILSVQKRKLELSKSQIKSPESELSRRLQGAPLLEFLKVSKELGASDLYISSGLRPMVRLHGNLIDLPAEAPGFEESRKMLLSVLTKEQVDAYYREKAVDLGLDFPFGRFRASVFRHLKGIAGIFRTIADRVMPFETLGLPGVVRQFLDLSRGLILVTGPAGSGKSTTLAALIDLLNKSQRLHIITIEDPIEVIHQSDRSLISQRQVPDHSRSFASALRAALREDPDVIVVGELRDPETVSTAITAAETGHLIFGTLHTHNAYRTILRILDQFPAQKRAHIRTLLAGVLRGVISQQLVPNIDGRGRSLACEILVANSAISNLIRDDRVWQIPMVMQTGKRFGMRLMDDSLLELVQRRKISLEEALQRATDKTKFINPEAQAEKARTAF